MVSRSNGLCTGNTITISGTENQKLSQSNELTEDDLKDILCEIKREDISRVTFKTEQLKKYFPKDYTVEKMKREIIDILKIWMDKYWDL